MEKMFVHIANKSLFTDTLKTKYTNSIVFIQDTQEIWTHGTFYAIPDEYKGKITSLQNAVKALNETYNFNAISDGTNTAQATATAKTINFKGTGATTVTVGENGVTINSTVNTLATGTANGTVKFNGTDVAVKGLGDAAYRTAKSFDDATKAAQDAADAAQAEAEAKVASVTAAANTAIVVAGTATAPTVGLKIASTQGNVTLSQTSDGLKAQVTIPEDKVKGVKSGDKVLALGTDKLLSSTLGLTYDATTKTIKLTGINNTVIASIDATAFVKDGMISKEGTSFNTATKVLTIGFNTDAGVESFDVDLSDLVDTYDGANLKLTAASGYAANTILDAAISDLKQKTEDAAAAGVTSFGGKTGAITLKSAGTANGTINLAMTNNQLGATIVGLGSAAYTASSNYATSAQGGKADTAIQNVRASNTGTYISVAAAKSGTTINLTPSVTTQAMATAGTAKGLAEASDVKQFVEDLFSWEEIS